MRVLFVNGAHPDDKIGGAELQSWLLAKELADHHDVTFLAVRSDNEKDTVTEQNGVSVIKLSKARKFSLRELRRIYRCVRSVAPDVIHLRMFDYIFLFKFASIRCDLPVVYHISSMYNCHAIRPGPLRQVVRKTRHLGNYLLMRHLAGLVCQTNDQKKEIGKTNRAITVVRNSAVGNWDGNSDQDEQLILWVGNIKSLKRPLDFVRIAEQFSTTQFRFLMIGFPQDRGLARKIVNRSRHLDNLEFIPGVPISEIGSYFRKASIFVSTSEVEGYPNTFIQAIQSATPVISLALDPDNVLTRYQVGICVPDLGRLATCLEGLLNDEKRLNAMRHNTRRCFDEHFDIVHNAKGLEQYLLSITAG